MLNIENVYKSFKNKKIPPRRGIYYCISDTKEQQKPQKHLKN